LHDLAISHDTVQGLAQLPRSGLRYSTDAWTGNLPLRASWTGPPFRLPFKCPLFWRCGAPHWKKTYRTMREAGCTTCRTDDKWT